MDNNNYNYLHLIKNNFLAYCIYITKGTFKTPPHVITICKLLDDLSNGITTRQIISLPPRMGKSYISSILFPSYLLGRDPTYKIIGSSYGWDLSKVFAKELLQIISSEEYKKIFPDTALLNDGKSSTLWYTTKGGYYKSTSRGSAITGLSAHFIIADDLIKNSTEAKSPSLLKSIQDWFWSTLYSRLTKKLDGSEPCVLLLMTRWSKNDLIGHLLDTNSEKTTDWDNLNLPALNEDGEALWEEMQPKKLLLEIKARDPETFSCLYQGMPGSVGTTEFNIQDYKIIEQQEELPERIKYYFSSWDTASKISSNNDWTVGTLWSVRSCGLLVLEDYIRGKYTLPQLKKVVLDKHNEWQCKFSIIEDANSGTGLLQLIESEESHRNYKFYGIKANVKQKLSTVIPLLYDHEVILRNYDILIQEISDYPYGKNDDSVASIVNAIWYWTIKIRGSSSEDHKPITRLNRRTTFETHLH